MGRTRICIISGLFSLLCHASWADPQDQVWRSTLQLPAETPELRQRLFQRLEQDPLQCHSLVDPIRVGDAMVSVAHVAGLVSEFAAKAAQKSDARCMRALAQSYAFHIGHLPWERDDFFEYCKGARSPLCAEARALSEQHKHNLRNLLAMSDGERGAALVEDCGDCQQSPRSQFKGLFDVLKEQREALNCVELKPGETKVIAYQDGQPSGLGGDYSLTKRPDGGFDVGVVTDVHDPDPARRTQMQERIKGCVAEANGFFKGPRGEQLKFNVMTKEEARQLPIANRPGTNRITILPEDARSNAAAYAANINCATVVHEVLHLTGLCDEYPGAGDGHTCRAVVRAPSIMANNVPAYEMALPKKLRCECQARACFDAMGGSSQAKRDFYLKRNIYAMSDYRFRNQHCTEKVLPTIRWSDSARLEATSIRIEEPLRVVTLSQEFIDHRDVVHRRETSCSCKAGDEACGAGLRQFAQRIREQRDLLNTGCPYGSTRLRTDGDQQWDGKVFGLTAPPELPSLLHPNQFLRITGGACAAKAPTYNQCAVWAYKSHEQTNNCQGKPDFCNDERVFLGVPQ